MPVSGEQVGGGDGGDLSAVENEGYVVARRIAPDRGIARSVGRAGRLGVDLDSPIHEVDDPVDRDTRPGVDAGFVPQRSVSSINWTVPS